MGTIDSTQAAQSVASLLLAVVILVFVVVKVVSVGILVSGIASTIVGWVPQPHLDTVYTAFWLYMASILITLLTNWTRAAIDLAAELNSGSELLILLGFASVAAVIIVPLFYLPYHAAATVWSALPSGYDTDASFLFFSAGFIGAVGRLMMVQSK